MSQCQDKNMPEISETNGYYFFKILGFQRRHMIECKSISSRKATPSNMCSQQSILKLLTSYQLLRGVYCLLKEKKIGQNAKLLFSRPCLVIVETKSLSQGVFPRAILSLLKIWWLNEMLCSVMLYSVALCFLLLPQSQ